MYFQRDYVLRMIEMMGELMRRICSIAREVDARLELDKISNKACGLPLSALRQMEPDTLSAMLDEPQRFLAAQLLLIEVEVAGRKQTEEELAPLWAQSIALFASLLEPDYVAPACAQVERILSEHLPLLSLEALGQSAALCERGGRFAACEDALYAAYELDVAERGSLIAFYDRMEAEDERTLLAGGLSREEIGEGRAALL